jgi:aspartate racemase
MIKEVGKYIKKEHPKIKKVGLLSTIGSYKSEIYSKTLKNNNITIITPTKNIQKDLVHSAIYNIKSQSDPITNIAKNKLINAIKYLKTKGAEVIILGCSEISLAFNDKNNYGIILIDPTDILARSLIRETYPTKLKDKLRI